jgi:TonB family protein
MRRYRSLAVALTAALALAGCARSSRPARPPAGTAAAAVAGEPTAGIPWKWARDLSACEPSALVPAAVDTAVYAEADVDRPARAVLTAAPNYPEGLRQRGVRGTVVATFVVGTGGCAEPASVRTSGAPEAPFAAAVRDAVLRTRFAPAERGGRPVRQRVTAPWAFHIGP